MKLLLRYGRLYGGGDTWTQAHGRWLAAQRFEHVPTELAYLDALAAVDGLLARRVALDERLSRLATEPEHWPTVARLRCFRGIETLSALVLHLEVGDWRRFQRPGQLAAWLGLVPSLHQSGESETRGSITKTGSGFARRILVEAAWHYLREPRIGVTLRNRQADQPDHILQIAWRAQHRLYVCTSDCAPVANRQTSSPSRSRASSPASSGRQPWPSRPTRSRLSRGGRRAEAAGTRDATMGRPRGNARS